MVNCSVMGCKSRSECKQENITFHTFPQDDAILNMWLRATGRHNWMPTKYTRICSKHFNDDCFRKTKHKVYLDKFSIPTLFVHNIPVCDKDKQEHQPSTSKQNEPMEYQMSEEHLNIPVYEKCIEEPQPSTSKHNEPMNYQMSDEQLNLSAAKLVDYQTNEKEQSRAVCSEAMKIRNNSPAAEALTGEHPLTPRKLKLTKELRQKTDLAESRKRKIALLRSKNQRLQKKNAELAAIIENLKSKHYLNQESADLLSSLNSTKTDFLKPNKSKFSPEVRKFALNLHFISPRAYNFVRQQFDTCLPHTRTLARWYQTVDGEPGFSSESLAALTLMFKNKKDSSKKVLCCLCFDEMALRRCVEWDGRQFTGFVNHGQKADQGDNLPVAKEALVFMLTCMNGSWKFPIGYFLVNGVTAEQKAELVKLCIDLVGECGIDIISLTFDGCPANLSMARVLGCKIDGAEIDPVFTHKGRKVAIFPDPSHMLKLTRNTLGDKAFLIDGEGKMICWHFIQLLVELQEDEGCHLANKIRAAHVNYKKQIMKVKLAAQLFSESVAIAVEYCKDELKLEEFQNSQATIDFIRKFNNLFDLLNSRNLNAYGFKKPLNPNNFDEICSFLNNMVDYIKSIKLGSSFILNTNRKTGFLRFLIAIQSLMFLYKEYVAKGSLDFLSTYKLSQDHLEIFFSAIRAKGGFNNNPTAKQFKSAFKRLLVHGELKHLTTGNCIPLSHINILMCKSPEVAINKTSDRNRLMDDNINQNFDETFQEEVVVSKDHDYLADPTRLTEFTRSVIIYIAGFVVKALENQLKCSECLSLLTAADKNVHTLQYKKDKGSLHYPSESVIQLCEIAEKAHRANKITTKKDHMHFLLQTCIKRSLGLKLFPEENVIGHLDGSHYVLLIKSICKKYLNVRIHYYTKSIVDKKDNIRNMYTKLILFKGQ